MKIFYEKSNKMWWAVDNEGWHICCARTPKEAKQKSRQWWMYLTASDEDTALKYLNGEIEVK